MSPSSENYGDEPVDQWADRYRSLVENANDGIYMVDAEGRIVSPNRAMADMYGYGVEEIEGMPVMDLHLPEDLPRAMEALKRAERGENVLERFSTRRKDGSQIWVEIKPVVIELGHRKFVFSITRDVTEGVLAEEALRASEERYRDIVENAFDVINSVDADGNVIEANQKMADLLGFSRAEIARMNVRDFVAPEHLEAISEHIARTAGQGLGQSLQCDWITREGRRVPVEINSTPRYSESGTFLVTRCIVRDISERRRLEAAFLQAQKMESVGRLAGGVAHDFNNLLTAIISYTQLGIQMAPSVGSLHVYLEEINKAAQKASDLTRQLLSISRRQIVSPTVIDLNDYLMGMETLLRRVIGEDTELVLSPAAKGPLVLVDPGQMEQVILNLVVNAHDAMPTGGRLSMGTSYTTADRPIARAGFGPIGGTYVLLTVSDTGVGMSEDVKAQVFEPFFTTKGPGEGSGLGLSTCYGIVAQSGGRIEVDSETGVGSTFRIYLPRVEGEATVLASRAEPAVLPTETETILLVEDDSSVRQMAALVLRKSGYAVIEAANGQEAFQLARKQDQSKISLLLSDIVMPLTGGVELVQQLKPVLPELRVLYMSGHTDQALTSRGVLRPETHILQKPFTPEMLTRSVREALDERNRKS